MGLTIDFSMGFICFDAATKVLCVVSLRVRGPGPNQGRLELLPAPVSTLTGYQVLDLRSSFLLIGDKLCLNMFIEKQEIEF